MWKSNKQKKERKAIQEYKWILKYVDVDRINLDINIGIDDVFITSMTIPVLSTVLAIILEKYFSKSTKRFLVKPIYNKLFFSLKNSTYITIKLKDIIYILFKFWKEYRKDKKTMVTV